MVHVQMRGLDVGAREVEAEDRAQQGRDGGEEDRERLHPVDIVAVEQPPRTPDPGDHGENADERPRDLLAGLVLLLLALGLILGDSVEAACKRAGRAAGWRRRDTNVMAALEEFSANFGGPPKGDLIIGLEKSAIGTLVERSSRYTMLLHLPRKDSIPPWPTAPGPPYSSRPERWMVPRP
jgi:hypothetical protein